MSVSFIAIDPGETVGWATGAVQLPQRAKNYGPVYARETDTLPAPETLIWPRPELVIDKYDQHKAKTFLLKLSAVAEGYDYIIYESYHITAAKLRQHLGSNVPTLRCIGGIELAAWRAQAQRKTGAPYLVDQEPRMKATGMAASKLHVPELVPVIEDALAGPHDDGHYGDAILHAVAWYHLNYA